MANSNNCVSLETFTIRSSIWKMIFGLLLYISFSGCGSTKVPGGYFYMFNMATVKNTLMEGKGGSYKYGRYKNIFGLDGGGGGEGILGLTEFYPLLVEWKSAAGIKRMEEIEIAPLIDKVRRHMEFPMAHNPVIRLVVNINAENLKITYSYLASPLGTASSNDTIFLLYESNVDKG